MAYGNLCDLDDRHASHGAIYCKQRQEDHRLK